jgi:hypothetical protein
MINYKVDVYILHVLRRRNPFPLKVLAALLSLFLSLSQKLFSTPKG